MLVWWLIHTVFFYVPCFISDHFTARQPEVKKGVLGEHTIKIDQDGLTETTEFNESRTKWTGMDAVQEDRDYIFIRPAGQVHTIPKRAFPEEEGAKQFYAQALMYFDRAQKD